MFTDIVLPVDRGVESNTIAAEQVAALADTPDSTVYVVHVQMSRGGKWDDDTSDDEPAPIVQMREFFAEKPCADRVRYIVAEGNPADGICDVAEQLDADVIVMPTHARKGLSRLALGSVTENVIRQAECPVLTMTADDRNPE